MIDGLFSAQGLPWLLRLRWLAVAGQFSTCVLVWALFGYELPWPVLCGFLAVTAVTNLVAHLAPGLLPRDPDVACAALLVQDTLVLTGMLWWTGGIDNPFTGFYLLHVVIAAVVLPRRWDIGALAVASICLACQFLSPHRLLPSRAISWMPEDLSKAGVLVGLVLAGASVVYYVGRLRTALREKEDVLEAARKLSERHERFAAVATLAAGIAHELATPLSTIAVVGSDLERMVLDGTSREDCVADAKLIRSEVERCRVILEGLGERATSGIGDPPCMVEIATIPVKLKPFLADAVWRALRFEGFDRAGLMVVPLPPLLQSLAALAKNAHDASDPQSPVRVAVSPSETEIVFRVVDQGVGMPPETAARIGEPFFTTKAAGKGMGLGVFLVRTFVERVQGSLEVESSPGAGTVVGLRIPRREGAS
ncbi:MAG: Sensor histidine kinase RegB [Fibrobacterota bacterium]|jgi:two-component system sensor histidine kinase RegB